MGNRKVAQVAVVLGRVRGPDETSGTGGHSLETRHYTFGSGDSQERRISFHK